MTTSSEGDGQLGGAWSIPRGPCVRVPPTLSSPFTHASRQRLPSLPASHSARKASSEEQRPWLLPTSSVHPGSCFSWLALFLVASLGDRALTAIPAGLNPPVPHPYQVMGELAYGQLKGAPGK